MEKEFLELINEHKGILHKICNVFFYQNPYKEDYYQEILIRLWKSYPGFKNLSSFSTWLYKVALNTAIDIIRKQNIQPRYDQLSKAVYAIPEQDSTIEIENKEVLYRAINQLSDVEKAIIILYLEEYSYKEISEIMGISEINTGVKISRIKGHLFKILRNGKK